MLTLVIYYKSHKLLLKESDTKPLKDEILINLTTLFKFNIQLRDWTDWIYSFFGKKLLQTNDVEFVKKYSIQTNDLLFC